MISGANEKQLELANARANIVMELDNTSTYESWLIIDTYIESLQQENQQHKNNWNELKKWLEENWTQSQDIWFVKIINKMQELEGKSE